MDDLDLSSRTGLPAHLRVLADMYPRADWRGHPNFSELTAFWLERHLMFRQLRDRLIAGSEAYLDAGTPGYGSELRQVTGFFLNQLHGHHQIEDQHYFPQFIPLDRRLERGFEMLDRDHHALDGHIHGLAQASNAVLARPAEGEDDRAEVDRLLSTQRGFGKFLERHLTDEEDLVVPVILEYGAGLG